MQTLGGGPWRGSVRALFVVAALGAWPGQSGPVDSGCEAAFGARLWAWAADACRDPRWGERAQLAQAWVAYDQKRKGEALASAEQLLSSDVAADAAYLAGSVLVECDGASEQALARARFEQALRDGQCADASRAAERLSRLLQDEGRFSDMLFMAKVAVTEAGGCGDDLVRGRAFAVRAEAYDFIGMEDDARDSFIQAEQLTAPWPAQRAHIFAKHAAFLLDLGTSLETSLSYFDMAAAMRLWAIFQGHESDVSLLALSISLNRADALSQLGGLGGLDAADGELAVAQWVIRDHPAPAQLAKLRLVEGYVAARRGHLAVAEARFAEAGDDSLEDDYRWRVALELARSYRATGHPDRAERAYRNAISIIEQLRGSAGAVEVRPWVLARRALPYEELLALLIEQRRGADALVIAESLHARAWLDVVLGNAANPLTEERALAAARIRQHLDVGVAPPLDRPSLMATIGDREALVFSTIGSAIWRAHIVRGAVAFSQLPADTPELANGFIKSPSDAAVSEQAAAALLPAALSDSRAPLYVIATGPLANVPFAALRWRGRYLIDARPVARLPGLAALRGTTSTWDSRAILVGDSHDNLNAARREVRELATAMSVRAHLGPAASRAAVTAARGARLLHVAAHGIPTSAGQAIELADGDLTAADVLDAGLDPEIVVLSGCATAASNDAESWDGFPSAFLAAGSRYVVATLRSVDDAPAAEVIEAYYAQPAELNPIERLAAAQRQVSGTVPVAVWASFAAWGSAACGDRAPRCPIPRPPASPERQASVGPAAVVQGR